MKLVITGSQGFIFSHVAEHFIKLGWEVHGFDNLSAGSHPELVVPMESMGNFHFHESDVSFMPVQDVILRINPDYIVHAAAISDVDYSIKQPVKTIMANNNATLNIFEAARKCKNLKKLLYVSTDEVYGECDHAKTEEEIIFPRNPYSLSKAFGSILRLAYDNTYPELRDKTVETRFCNVWGDRQDSRKIIPAIRRALKTGTALALHDGGTGYRQWIHVSEIPGAIEILLEKGDRTYNITSEFGMSVIDLITMAERLTGKTVPTKPGKRGGMDRSYEMSGRRMLAQFDWFPRVKFEEAYKAYLNEV